jgi:hypothetical protein
MYFQRTSVEEMVCTAIEINQMKIEFWTASCASGPIVIDFQELLVYPPVGAYVFLFE